MPYESFFSSQIHDEIQYYDLMTIELSLMCVVNIFFDNKSLCRSFLIDVILIL